MLLIKLLAAGCVLVLLSLLLMASLAWIHRPDLSLKDFFRELIREIIRKRN